MSDAHLPQSTVWQIMALLGVSYVVYTLIIRWLAKRHIRALAGRLGINPAEGDDQSLLSGIVRGKRVRFAEITTDISEADVNSPDFDSSGDNIPMLTRLLNSSSNRNRNSKNIREQWAEMAVAVNSHDFEFALQPETLETKVREFFGETEVKVGDAVFDRRWRVDTSRRETLLALLTPELRAKITQAADRGGQSEFRIEYKWLCYREKGTFASDGRLRRCEGMLDLMFELADAIEVAVEADHKL